MAYDVDRSTHTRVRILSPSDLDRAVSVLCSAFTDDALLAWACGARAPRAMPIGFRMTAGLLARQRSVYGYFDGDELVGALLVQTPDVKLSIRAGLGAGLLELPFGAGFRGAARLIRTFLVTEKFKEETMGGRPFIYIDTLGVRLDRTGRGIGTELMNAAMTDLARSRREPFLLLTHNPRNHTFYRRLGFESIAACPIANSPITFSVMLKPSA